LYLLDPEQPVETLRKSLQALLYVSAGIQE